MTVLRKKFLNLPKKKQEAIVKFSEVYKKLGYECFLVGGSCRDLLLGMEPNDFDFASNCPLAVTETLFPRVIPTGESHGTLTVIFADLQFEVTRYRKDISTDGRRAVIAFAETIEEDQKRRDLRLNTVAYDVIEDRIVDSQDAMKDFENKVIRFVGQAQERIREDHLRALRYGRMILNLKPLGFTYLQEEMDQVIQIFDGEFLSVERLFDELMKMLTKKPGDEAFLIRFLSDLRVFRKFGFDETLTKEVIQSVTKSNSLVPLWFAYLRGHGLMNTVRSMRLSRHNKRLIQLMAEFEHQDLSSEAVIKEFLYRADGIDRLQLLNSVNYVLNIDISTAVNKITKDNNPLHIKDLAVDGNDLKRIDITGRNIGLTLEFLLKTVWKRPSINRKQTLMTLAAEYHKKNG